MGYRVIWVIGYVKTLRCRTVQIELETTYDYVRTEILGLKLKDGLNENFTITC